MWRFGSIFGCVHLFCEESRCSVRAPVCWESGNPGIRESGIRESGNPGIPDSAVPAAPDPCQLWRVCVYYWLYVWECVCRFVSWCYWKCVACMLVCDNDVIKIVNNHDPSFKRLRTDVHDVGGNIYVKKLVSVRVWRGRCCSMIFHSVSSWTLNILTWNNIKRRAIYLLYKIRCDFFPAPFSPNYIKHVL